MKSTLLIALGLLAAGSLAQAGDAPTRGKVCTTLGKVHAQRDLQLYPVSFQSINGELTPRRTDPCVMLESGKYKLGIASNPGAGAFPRSRAPRERLKEKILEIEIVAGHTYTIAAQIKDRSQVDWMPIVERDEVWNSAR